MSVPKSEPNKLNQLYRVEAAHINNTRFLNGPMPTYIFAVILASYWLAGKDYVLGDIRVWWGVMFFALVCDLLLNQNALNIIKTDISKWYRYWGLRNAYMAISYNSIYLLMDTNNFEAVMLIFFSHGFNILSASLFMSLNAVILGIFLGLSIFVGFIAFWESNYFLQFILFTAISLASSLVFSLKIRTLFQETIRQRIEKEELIEELRNQKDIAVDASLSKTKFLAAASHDLRQPLQSISLLQAALSSYLTTDKQKEIQRKSKKSLNSLNELLDSLLDISKLDAEIVSVNKVAFDLNELLLQETDKYRLDIENKGIQFRINCTVEGIVYSDPIILSRILSNLLSNAQKYTVEGMITVSAEACGNSVIIKLIDTGLGIPEDKLEKVFKEFYQIDNPERDRTKGLGLGLSIVNRLTNLLGTEIDVQSSLNQGTTFKLTLTDIIEPSEAQTSLQKVKEFPPISGKKILVVDDEIEIRESMELLLESWHCQVFTAENLDGALIKSDDIDILIVDFRLRDNITGLQCIHAIQNELGKDIPSLIITGDTEPERVKQIEETGIPFIHKPVNADELRTILSSFS